MPHNVMILSAGRRGLLVDYFRRELRQAVPGASVLAADASPHLSAACQIADASVRTPRVDDARYIDGLVNLCQEHSVGVVVPTIDTDLIELAMNRKRFAQVGAEVVVPDVGLVRQCRDKRLSDKLFARHGVPTPQLVDPLDERAYPLIAKPFNGSSSNRIHIASRRDELPSGLIDEQDMLFYEYLSPSEHDEYTIDMYFDRSGALRCFVPRLRIATRAGEVSKARTSRIPQLDSIGRLFANVTGARGCVTTQLFVHKRTGQMAGIEINPRFGGGFPLSYEAGANFPAWILAEYLHEERVPYFDEWKDQLTMLRYDTHVLVAGAA